MKVKIGYTTTSIACKTWGDGVELYKTKSHGEGMEGAPDLNWAKRKWDLGPKREAYVEWGEGKALGGLVEFWFRYRQGHRDSGQKMRMTYRSILGRSKTLQCRSLKGPFRRT